jgi:aminopeptidase N
MTRTVLTSLLILLVASGLPFHLSAQENTGSTSRDRFGEIDRDLLINHERPAHLAAADGRRILRAPDPTPEQLQMDVLHYDVDIAFDEITGLVEGRVTAIIQSTADSLFQIDFNADPVLNILAVELNAGEPWIFSRSGDVVTVFLPTGLAAGETITITYYFDGDPTAAAASGLFIKSHDSGQVIYSLSEPWSARTWWPCKDYPDDKATFDIALSVRPPLFAASNGDYLGQADTIRFGETFTRYTWKENYPMPPYLFSIAASEYVLLTDHWNYAPGETMQVTNFVYPHLATEAAIDLSIEIPSLQFFSDLLGMYPFVEEKYGVAICGIGGGMEHQTLTSYGSMLLTGDNRYDWLYIHELGHQWFGDHVTCADWAHIWLNEGWASYSEALWFEHLGGQTSLTSYMQTMDTPQYWTGPVLRDPDVSDPWYYFNRVVYDKGAWVVHMLRHVMGDEAFFDATRAYLADPQFAYGNADTEQFESFFEGFYGGQLDWFFDPWLTRTDRLTYQWDWNSWEEAGRYFVSIQVDQTTHPLYVMPVEFSLTTGAGDSDTTLWVDEQEEYYMFETASLVTDIRFDPDGWILCDHSRVTSGLDMPSVPFLSQNFPNPFNPSTTIRFGIDSPGHVRISVYDARGALVKTLVDEKLGEGAHEAVWNGTGSDGRNVSSGVYFCRMTSGELSMTRKMVLLR